MPQRVDHLDVHGFLPRQRVCGPAYGGDPAGRLVKGNGGGLFDDQAPARDAYQSVDRAEVDRYARPEAPDAHLCNCCPKCQWMPAPSMASAKPWTSAAADVWPRGAKRGSRVPAAGAWRTRASRYGKLSRTATAGPDHSCNVAAILTHRATRAPRVRPRLASPRSRGRRAWSYRRYARTTRN